jgi:predicted HTH domain antitoxin
LILLHGEIAYVKAIALLLSINYLCKNAIAHPLIIQLYAQNIFTFAQTRHLANLSAWKFQQLLGQNKIERHYNKADLAQDMETINTGF